MEQAESFRNYWDNGGLSMKINILDQLYDDVIKCTYLTVSVRYEDAVRELCPLMDKLDFQRNPLS